MAYKLKSFTKGDIIISQGYHGIYQGSKAMDFAHLKFYAPDRARITRVHIHRNRKLSWFDMTTGHYTIRVVHALPFKTGWVNPGEHIANSTWHHFHIAIFINGKWEPLLAFTDRRTRLRRIPGLSSKWTNWGMYPSGFIPGRTDIIKPNKTKPKKMRYNQVITRAFNGWYVQVMADSNGHIQFRRSRDGINWTKRGDRTGQTYTPMDFQVMGDVLVLTIAGTDGRFFTRYSKDGEKFTKWELAK